MKYTEFHIDPYYYRCPCRGMNLGTKVMLDLVVHPDEVCWRWNMLELTSDVVSNRAVCIGDKTVLVIEFISICLELSVDDEAVCRFIFMV